MRVERLPFTVYDVLGYLVPGFFACSLALAAFGGSSAFEKLNVYSPDTTGQVLAATFLLIVSYIMGQFVGLLSSITIEKLVCAYLGYPSRYLFEAYTFRGNAEERTISVNAHREREKFKQVRWCEILLMPIVPFMLLADACGLFGVLIRPFKKNSDETCEILRCLQLKLKERGLGSFDNLKNEEWFRCVNFYAINNFPSALVRMYNYMTLYGFFRNMSFIFCALAWMPWLPWVRFENGDVYKTFLFLSPGFAFCSFLLVLGFIKFFRRYSEEAILAFVLTENEKTIKQHI